MLNEKRAIGWLEDESLVEGKRMIVICLQLTENHNNNAAIKSWLTVNGIYNMLNFLKAQRLKLLQDLCAAHLLRTFKSEK